MSLVVDDLPDDLPDRLPAAPTSPPVIDGDTGEVMLSPAAQVRLASDIVVRNGSLIAQVAVEAQTYSIAEATPDERQALVEFYWSLRSILEPLQMRVRAIEFIWARGMEELGAKKLPLPDGGVVEYTASTGEWKVNAEALRSELQRLSREEGTVTNDDIEAALPVVVTYKADNRVLQRLINQSSEAVRQAIEANRVKVVPPTASGRVKLPQPKGGL